jgi:hypothetical protein
MKMEQTGCSETLAFKLQTPGNHPEESIQQRVAVCRVFLLNTNGALPLVMKALCVSCRMKTNQPSVSALNLITFPIMRQENEENIRTPVMAQPYLLQTETDIEYPEGEQFTCN